MQGRSCSWYFTLTGSSKNLIIRVPHYYTFPPCDKDYQSHLPSPVGDQRSLTPPFPVVLSPTKSSITPTPAIANQQRKPHGTPPFFFPISRSGDNREANLSGRYLWGVQRIDGGCAVIKSEARSYARQGRGAQPRIRDGV